MAAISPFMWIGVGALVLVVSLLLPGLRLFLFVGILFIAFGVVRMFLSRAESPRPHNQHTYHRHHPREPRVGDMQKTCFVCAAKNHAAANYCGHCGNRLS